MPSWVQFAWGAVFFKAMAHGDECYCELMVNRSLLTKLRKTPKTVTVAEVRDHVVGFLNQWKTRVPPGSALGLRDAVCDINLDLVRLAKHDLRSEALGADQAEREGELSLYGLAARCYDRLDRVPRIGPTAASKVLHVLHPAFFVMWDAEILAHYQRVDSTIDETGSGYAAYLRRMQRLAEEVTAEFEKGDACSSGGANVTPETYLSARLEYAVPKTMAKYVDEFNWITITSGVSVPPRWHP